MDETLRAYLYLLLGWVIICFCLTLSYLIFKFTRSCTTVYGDIVETSVVGSSRRIDPNSISTASHV
ncbi:p7 [Tobacco virus 1]|uniref:p7 n=1 Tax=Tobacco virus 1 TaxID=1692045 RepID=A0A0K1HRL8_9CLOS|nr:p7 [Tobacco virus 1]AKT94759.1 p7 [Tobacco virus 1]